MSLDFSVLKKYCKGSALSHGNNRNCYSALSGESYDEDGPGEQKQYWLRKTAGCIIYQAENENLFCNTRNRGLEPKTSSIRQVNVVKWVTYSGHQIPNQ